MIRLKINYSVLFILLVGILTFYFTLLNIPIDYSTESSLFLSAFRILNGQFPYIDFYSMQAPGLFYIYSLIYKLFGYNIIAGRIFTICIHIFNSISIYYLIKRISSNNFLFYLSPFLYIIISAAIPNFNDSLAIGIAFNLVSAIYLAKYFESEKTQLLIIAGFILGVGAIFRHDLASFIYGAQFWSAFFFGIHKQKNTELKFLKKAIFGFKEGIYYSLGFFAPVIPTFIYLVYKTNIFIIWDQLFYQPFYANKPFISLPFPNPFTSFEGFIYYLPAIVLIITLFYIIISNKRKILTPNFTKFWVMWFLFNLGINYYNIALSRSNLINVYPAIIAAIIILPGLIEININKYLSYSIIFINAVFTFFGFYQFNNISIPTKANQNEIINYIKNESKHYERIFIIGKDSLTNWKPDPNLYLKCERLPASKYDNLAQGIINDSTNQLTILNELENKCKFIIRDPRTNIIESNKINTKFNLKILEDYISRRFIPVFTCNNYQILKKVP